MCLGVLLWLSVCDRVFCLYWFKLALVYVMCRVFVCGMFNVSVYLVCDEVCVVVWYVCLCVRR